jgi:hypothetical protein
MPSSPPPTTRATRSRLLPGLNGPLPAWPRPLDALAEGWGRLRPRVRVVVVLATLLALATATQARVRAAEQRWGGAPITVLVAEHALPVGALATGLRRVELPPRAVPPDPAPPDATEAGAVLALALPEGAVLTRSHLDPRGPAAGLAPDLRALPIPVADGWGVAAGGWVDVWVLGSGESPAALVARSRPVLEVRGEDSERTALVGLHAGEVGSTTAGLALGQVLLAHAPPPGEKAGGAS